MQSPTLLEFWLIAGALWSLRVVSRRGFAENYRKFAADKLQNTTPRARVAMGVVSIIICLPFWPVGVIGTIINFVLWAIVAAWKWGKRR